jgi:YfaZ precursor
MGYMNMSAAMYPTPVMHAALTVCACPGKRNQMPVSRSDAAVCPINNIQDASPQFGLSFAVKIIPNDTKELKVMPMRYLAAFLMLTASTTVLADTIDLNLNNNTAQFQYGTATPTSIQGQSNFHVGLLYNNSNSVLVNAGLMVQGNVENAPGLSLGAGVEALAAVIKDNPPTRSNASAVALDGLVRFAPPAASQIGFVGEVHYAPKIITFADATRYSFFATRVEYEITPETVAYGGYRRVAFGIKNGPNAVLDSGPYVGIKIGF